MPTTGILTGAAYALDDAVRARSPGADGTRRRRLREHDQDGDDDEDRARHDGSATGVDVPSRLLPARWPCSAGGPGGREDRGRRQRFDLAAPARPDRRRTTTRADFLDAESRSLVRRVERRRGPPDDERLDAARAGPGRLHADPVPERESSRDRRQALHP